MTNLQGDVLHIVNASGTPVVSYAYDPYGKPTITLDIPDISLGAINPLRYRGYYYDTETQLYYLQSRYYDPTTCRFINADSYASTGQGILGHNMFAYCNNNPNNYIDTLGQFGTVVINDGSTGLYSTWALEGMLGPYNVLKKLAAGTGYEVHHLIEKRFYEAGVPFSKYSKWNAPSVIIKPSDHQEITNKARPQFPYGKTNYSQLKAQQVMGYFKNEYKQMGKNDWVEYLEFCYE